MFTKLQNKRTGKIVTFRTQQYEIGMYYIQDDNSALQGGLDIPEATFHQDLRAGKILKGNWKVIWPHNGWQYSIDYNRPLLALIRSFNGMI